MKLSKQIRHSTSSLFVYMHRFRWFFFFLIDLENRQSCRFPELFGSLQHLPVWFSKLTSIPFEA